MIPLLVAVGAGTGAGVRYLVATRLDRDRLPVGAWAVNVVGSFVLGVVLGAGAGPSAVALLGTGFCGGLTTYSSFALQTHTLGWARGAAYAVVTLGLALAACALGWAVGRPLA